MKLRAIMAGTQKCMSANFHESAGKQCRAISTRSGFRVSQVDYSRILDLKDMKTSGQHGSNSTFIRRSISSSSGLAHIKTGALYDKKNASWWISTRITSVIPKMQLFVRLIGTENTFVMLMPVDITIGSFIHTSLMEAGLQPWTPVKLTLKGRDIKLTNPTTGLLRASGVRHLDTITI